MKSFYKEICLLLKKVPKMDKDTALGILAPLETEDQAKEMLNFLYHVDLETTKLSPLIEKAMELGGMQILIPPGRKLNG